MHLCVYVNERRETKKKNEFKCCRMYVYRFVCMCVSPAKKKWMNNEFQNEKEKQQQPKITLEYTFQTTFDEAINSKFSKMCDN